MKQLLKTLLVVPLVCSMVLGQTVSAESGRYDLWQLNTDKSSSHKVKECPAVVGPYTDKMNFVSKYKGSDSGRDKLNKLALERYNASVSVIRALEKNTVKFANRYLATGKSAYRDCVLEWLGIWADSEAMLDPNANRTGVFVRKWALGSIVHAALQISHDGRPLPDNIVRWFNQLTKQVIVDFDERPLRNHNNHDYWAAWSVALAGILLEDRAAYDWAIAEWNIAMDNIDNGYLPKELSRKTRALEYHNYALQPLFFIADLDCEVNSSDLIRHPKLHQLIGRVADGIVNNDVFVDQTGHKQNTKKLYKKGNMLWWSRYKSRFEVFPAPIEKYIDTSHKSTRLGGDLRLLVPPKDC